MNDFVILADTACDISNELLEKWGVRCADLSFTFENDTKNYTRNDITITDFYEKMRWGSVAKTSAVNVDGFKEMFEPFLKEGKDILYLGFSSGLSTTFNSARLAADELMSEYTDRNIICVDSLSASAGYGLHLYLTVEKKKNGYDLNETAAYAVNIRPNICHWFTVDDLVYLKRGGRISPAVAFVGGVLGIKPILHVDNEGHLINVSKARGRKNSIKALADKYTELASTPSEGTIFISHADSESDAFALANIIKEQHKVNIELITDIGPVIGAHAGPGTIALFFVGKER